MVLLTRIYTKTGDKGTTSLGNSQRVHKDCARIEAIGAVDEANACLGWAVPLCEERMAKILVRLQNDLFDVGADLCVPENTTAPQHPLRVLLSQVNYLEQQIDELNATLPALTSFVLPGGTPAAAALHMARTIVRRAERRVVTLHAQEPLNLHLISYLNRLSDLLFVMARYGNAQAGQGGNVLWVPGANR